MVQLTNSALRLAASELAISALRPTIYRPSRPVPRVTVPDQRDVDPARRPATRTPLTPERGKAPVKPS